MRRAVYEFLVHITVEEATRAYMEAAVVARRDKAQQAAGKEAVCHQISHAEVLMRTGYLSLTPSEA